MKKYFKITLVIALSLFLLVAIFKSWFYFQEKYVCTPKIILSVDRFIESVQANNYSTFNEKSIFVDERHFQDIKRKISKSYTLKIKDWSADFEAYVIIKFNTGFTYALMLVPLETSLVSCRNAEYKVLTIR